MLIRSLALFFALSFMLVSTAFAESTGGDKGDKTLGIFGKWRAYISKTNNQSVCYMALAQQFPSSKKFKRGPAYLMITHRPSEGSTDVFSYTTGYSFKPAEDAAATIGKDQFNLFTDKTTAWARDPHTDHAITLALRSASSFSFTGMPLTKGIATKVTDKVDLVGTELAYHTISRACGLEKAPQTEAKKATKKSAAKSASTTTTGSH